ncbi:hypothetical protein [Streptomyces bluensis]|uniref:hypothetical protein n=1 Tax=Streptomyces bluensis TaxID=33897 RepID=UPI0019ACEE45|nr:hypothetical protein [Streptomyces bluensis]GGZ92780.1 hypothetical protein GCM10010344_70570 [Streptomyces bluensis]
MARIRTVKPEMFESESLAECSVTAMLTFIGLLTQADDSGRHRDHPAIIAGRLWALRPEHTAAHVAQDLEELATAGLICRYTGCDGRTWLHVVTWEQHQKINKPTASRIPRCPSHQGSQSCGKCQAAACPAMRMASSVTSPGTLREDSGSPQGGVQTPSLPLAEPQASTADPGKPLPVPPDGLADATPVPSGKTAGQAAFPEDSRRTTGGVREDSRPGSRILDPGSFLKGREAPAPDAVPGSVSAKDLVAEYVRGCHRRPPEDFLGHLGRKVKVLLDERFDPQDVRAALERLRAKGLHPSVLPSLVNEVVNASPPQAASAASSASGAGPWASTTTSGYTPYLNPSAEPTTFGGRL